MSLKIKALRLLSRRNSLKLGFLAGGAIAGAAAGANIGQPGLKGEAAVSGAITGATVGSLPIIGKPALKIINRGIATAPAVRNAARGARVMFRRIRGRIVPIRQK